MRGRQQQPRPSHGAALGRPAVAQARVPWVRSGAASRGFPPQCATAAPVAVNSGQHGDDKALGGQAHLAAIRKPGAHGGHGRVRSASSSTTKGSDPPGSVWTSAGRSGAACTAPAAGLPVNARLKSGSCMTAAMRSTGRPDPENARQHTCAAPHVATQWRIAERWGRAWDHGIAGHQGRRRATEYLPDGKIPRENQPALPPEGGKRHGCGRWFLLLIREPSACSATYSQFPPICRFCKRLARVCPSPG